VRQNGMVIYESTVPPGPFVIDDLYPTGYGSDLDVLITEADGTERTSRLPYAADVRALRPGATRYSLTAGSYRDPLLRNHPWLIEATLRRGLTNLLTGYGGVTAAQGYQAAQGGAALNTRFGAVGLDLTLARTQLPGRPPLQGNSLRLSYSKLLSSDTNITLASYRYSSASYLSLRDAMQLRNPVREPWYQAGNLPDQWQVPPPWVQRRDANPLPNGRMRGQWMININQTLHTGSVFLNGSTQDYWDRRGHSTQFSAGYNTSWRDVTAGISLARQYDPLRGRWDNQAMLNISMPLGAPGRSAMRSISQVQYSQRSGVSLTQSLTGSAGVDNNFSYAANAGYGMDRRTATAGANVTYQAPVVTLTAGASRGNDYDQVNAGISGGFVVYRGGVAFTPTMGDTLAIVEAKGAAGARVAAGSGLRVDRNGHAVVANLMPFQQNEIEIDPKGLPMNTELGTTTQRTVPSDGAVVPLQFEVQAGGRAALVEAMLEDGQLLPFGAEVIDAQGQTVGVVAQAGRVMLRNLSTDQGTYTIRWGDQPEQRCALEVTLPPAAPTDRGWQRMPGTCRSDGPLVQTKPDAPAKEADPPHTSEQSAPPTAQKTPAPRVSPLTMQSKRPPAGGRTRSAGFDAIGALPMATWSGATRRMLPATTLARISS
jgi:outer membrane usher protein